jgi:membrane protein DedA with SNARE-associated domain
MPPLNFNPVSALALTMRACELMAQLGSVNIMQASWLLDMEAMMRPLITYLQMNQQMILPVVFLIAFAECVAFLSFLVPATLFFSLFGAFAGAAGLSLAPIALAISLGAGLGFWASYWAGEKLGPRAQNHWPFSANPKMLERGHAFFEKWGMAGIFFGHFIGPMRAVIAIVAGICHMPFVPFQIANWAASFAWGFGLTYGGGILGKQAGLM